MKETSLYKQYYTNYYELRQTTKESRSWKRRKKWHNNETGKMKSGCGRVAIDEQRIPNPMNHHLMKEGCAQQQQWPILKSVITMSSMKINFKHNQHRLSHSHICEIVNQCLQIFVSLVILT